MAITYGPEKPILTKTIAFAKANLDIQQFGQANDEWVWNGATACTHAIWQFLIQLWTGHRLTLNQINSLAGMPKWASKNGVPRGMNSNEVSALIAAVNKKYGAGSLPYVVVFDYTFEQLLGYSNRAPLFYAMAYGKAPSWKGYTYHGLTAKSPFAYYAGRTQLGTNFRHAVLLLGYRSILSPDGTVAPGNYHEWKKDPNHNSPARPEDPPYEIIMTGQGKNEYNGYLQLGVSHLYAAVPTKSLPL